ncbi:MAG: hypothetical protein MMC33_009382 [Icmadophila ericetorum]|nr:hypothetical protein [Icmadophila ericetorum]
MAPTSGILHVTMQPKPELPPAQFHDWYNNEHGPGRLRLHFIQNGFRYRATDLEGPGKGMPEWMAIYDITDMAKLESEEYTRLRKAPVQSQRERDTMKKITVDRKFFDFVESRESKEFKRLEDVNNEGQGNVMIAVSLILHPEKKAELDRWYAEEHIDLISKVPGWRRTRRFKTSTLENKNDIEYLALHEYAPENGLAGPEFIAATTTPWCDKIWSEVVKVRGRRVYDLYYTFGPAPRDLQPLFTADVAPFTSSDEKTSTHPSPGDHMGSIDSYVTTKDGVILPYHLEGSTDLHAPLIILSNSILVDWGIWDGFVTQFFQQEQNYKYRVLRYHTRGRTSDCGNALITVDVLASDIIALLDALRVPQAAVLIGVSLGGATVLNAALKHPTRVAAFVSCDTSSKSPEGNIKAWGERIKVAEEEGLKTQSGEGVVGENLAEMTTRRWFVKESYDGGSVQKECERVKEMVLNNSLEGFRKSVEALFEYDLREEMKSAKAKAAFVVGGGDGVLPKTMKAMAESYGTGAEYHVIDGAGHLPMVEKPKEFAAVVTNFLASG